MIQNLLKVGFLGYLESVTSEPCSLDQVGPHTCKDPAEFYVRLCSQPLLEFEAYGEYWPQLRKTALLCSVCSTSQPIVYHSVFSVPQLSGTTTMVETILVSVYLDPQCSPVPFAQLSFSSVLPVYDVWIQSYIPFIMPTCCV